MLEQIIENIIQKIRTEVVKPSMDQIPLAYIFTRNIPDSVKHFFDQEVEIWLREESEKFSDSDRFNYEAPEIQMLVDKIFDVLKQTATFHPNRFNRLLERSIKLEANYLIRPHQTLTQFLFKDKKVITTIEVYDMLKYFDKFQYYKDALTEYFNLKYLREISQVQFEELIKGIDLQVFSRNPVETALQTIKTIGNFISEGSEGENGQMSVQMLSMILRDRNLSDFAQLVEREGNNGADKLTLTELEALLRTGQSPRLSTPTPAPTPVEQPLPKPIPVETLEDIEQDKPAVHVEEIQVPQQVEPEEVIEEDDSDSFEEEELPVIAETKGMTMRDPSYTAAEHLANVVGNKMKGTDLGDLNTMITVKQRKRFIKRIFKKQEKQYDEFISIVNGTETWKDASNLIDSFFYKLSTNPYSKEALEFSDLIYNRYFPNDIAVHKGDEFRY
ncbi:MAG: hypothetical protein ACRBF0_12655 [Calditrichia bacterium]